jgi:hypothetical protein
MVTSTQSRSFPPWGYCAADRAVALFLGGRRCGGSLWRRRHQNQDALPPAAAPSGGVDIKTKTLYRLRRLPLAASTSKPRRSTACGGSLWRRRHQKENALPPAAAPSGGVDIKTKTLYRLRRLPLAASTSKGKRSTACGGSFAARPAEVREPRALKPSASTSGREIQSEASSVHRSRSRPMLRRSLART